MKVLLKALLQPTDMLFKYEHENDYTRRLAMLEEIKTYPFNIIWDEYCRRQNVPIGTTWIDECFKYENEISIKRK